MSPVGVFLYGYYGHGNLGDDLLLRAVIEGIRRLRPDAVFAVQSHGPVAGLAKLGVEVESVDIDHILSDRRRARPLRLWAMLQTYARHFRHCDWLVFGGGTVFHERPNAVSLTLILLMCALARLQGLRIAALGVGVATLPSPLGRFLLRQIVRLTDLFVVRDAAALAECEKAGVAARVRSGGDLVYGLATTFHITRAVDHRDGPQQKPLLALSLHPTSLPDNPQGDRTLAILRDAMSQLLNGGWQLRLLSFQDGAAADAGAVHDRSVLSRLLIGLAPERRSAVTERAVIADDAAIEDVFAGVTLHCGMRFHGHVLASILGIPFVGIAHDNKIDEICRAFAMPCFPIEELVADELVAAIEATQWRKSDCTALQTCIAQAAENFTGLADAMAR